MNKIHVLAAGILLALSGAAFGNFPDPYPVDAPDPLPVASAAPCACLAGSPCECPACECGLTICGPGQFAGCSGPGCTAGGCGSGGSALIYSAPQPLAYSLRSSPPTQQMGHTHACRRCGYVWDHTEDGGAHLCPKCRTPENVVSNRPPTRLSGSGYTQVVRYSNPDPYPVTGYEVSNPAAFAPAPVYQTYAASFSGMSGGCGSSSGMSGGCSSGATASGRQPLMRVRGGPGILSGLCGRCR